MSDWEDIQGKRYAGYGRCIYCGSDGGEEGLRDEHIIPLALGGRTIIEKASCRECERLINPVDTHLAKAVYGDFRVHTKAPTRNPKERPSVLPASFTVEGKDLKLDLPVADHPYTLALPVWGDAGFFRGAPIDAPVPEPLMHLYHFMPSNMRETLGLTESEDFRIWSSGRINATLFARGIAKIAYCHLVLQHGLDGFCPMALPDSILGRCPGVAYLVGGPQTTPPPPMPKGHLHMIRHVNVDGQDEHEKSLGSSLKLHLVYVRLFANSAHKDHGMPIYHVVAGARRKPRASSLRRHLVTPRVIEVPPIT